MTIAAPASGHQDATAEGPGSLVCENVSVRYGRHLVLDDVGFRVASGEWLGILGPNGAGKSTLLRTIVGLVPHDGTVAGDHGLPPAPTDVAMVPQKPALPDGMTVIEYVLLGRTAHLGWLARESKRDRAVVASVLRRLDLAPFATRALSALSGGEAQRVVVARALAQQTPLLLFDEPTSALDLGHQTSVLELVDDLRQSDGLTVVAAMHDLSTAARFADRLLLIDPGRLLAHGSPADVLEADLLSEVYRTELTVRRIDGELVVLPAPRSSRNRSL